MRWVGFAGGVLLLVATLLSVVGTLVVPRGIDSRISRVCERAVDLGFLTAARLARTFVRRDRILAWQGPVALLVRLGLWIALLVVGYGLVLLPYVPGSVAHAFSEAGSSMFTLGYAAPTDGRTTAIDYVAAFTGLIVVGLQIGYLPTLYAAFNRRETEVTLLISRAGVPAWGPEILARTRFGIYEGDPRPVLDELFTAWERWAAEVAESHTTYLSLVRLRSPRPLSHWLTSLIAVMDAAALHLALMPNSDPKLSSRLCLRMGFVALNQIGRAMRLPVRDEAAGDEEISVGYDDFAAAVTMLQSLNYPMERTAEEAWPHFRGWRVNYDAVALRMCHALDAPPALWTGSRRWPSTPMAPIRPPAGPLAARRRPPEVPTP
ncbi:hypothetical protein [Jatrophihabitans sp.]|uniref:hypothetical protein n=1 Tax=Jatrophihabitans sp. TaxID=1932789 RepID=UPI0030C76472|nr:hypothetical protein [Jatrophihabitans sp.]